MSPDAPDVETACSSPGYGSSVNDLERRIRSAVERHPDVRAVRLAGSRQRGTPTELSDWDFKVETSNFERVADDLPSLVTPLTPLAQQWDPLAETACYMLLLRGPTKVDFLFDRPQEPNPPWSVSGETLLAIDEHFWDWVLWLASKESAGKDELVQDELAKMSTFLLGPLGVPDVPASILAAVRNYRGARERAERRWGVTVPRDIESEVSAVVV